MHSAEETELAPAPPGVGRRGRLAVGAVVLLVAVIAVSATIALSADPDGATPGAAPPATSAPVTGEPTEGVAPAGPATRFPDPDMPLGPDGRPLVDGIATSGPRYEQGARLLAELIAVVPLGFTVPATDSPPLPTAEPPAGQAPPSDVDLFGRTHQARFIQKTQGVEVWSYEASLAVSAGPNTGMLAVTVTTPGLPRPPEDVCAAIAAEPAGDCERVDVGGREVMVLGLSGDGPGSDLRRAEYVHPDGTVVSVLHSQDGAGDGRSALPVPVFDVRQLAELAVDDRFRVA